MFNAFLLVLTPLLLVFGLYHLFTWFNVFGINRYVYWKRVGLTSGIAHFLLATGFFLFAWYDLSRFTSRLSRIDYGTFVFQHSAFWQLLTTLDTLALLGTLGAFSLMGPAVSSDRLALVAIAMTYILGTVQWYFIGGGIGAVLQKIWGGLKTGEEGEEWFR